MKRIVFTVIYLLALMSSNAQPIIELESYAIGFEEPVDLAHAGDGRLFVVEKEGKIRIIDSDGTVLAGNFLDITSTVGALYSEQGLLGLTFHPNYDVNGYFYVYYTDNDENTVVARYNVNPLDSNDADEESELIIYTADQPYWNHNGGCIKFGPDGYLYIGLGDGGSGGDPGNRAQNPANKLGKIHRIDVDAAEPFAIPESNPFYGAPDTLETIWSIGLRNPWRFSFDALTGDMWVGDVGQNLYEEVNFEPAGIGGFNYGWRCYEGNHSFSLGGCEDEEFYTFPIHEYNHSFSTGGFAVTGGFVYRGAAFPGMQGYYIFADYVSGNWWHSYPDGVGGFTTTFLDEIEDEVSTFGEDVNGELYCADMGIGIIYKITDACGAFDISVSGTDFFCDEFPGSAIVEITEGVEPINILWSTGSTEAEITDLTAGDYSVTVTDDLGCVRQKSISINNLEPVPATPVLSIDNTLSVSEGEAWQWYINGNPIEGATDSNYTATESGIYSVVITYASGCTIESNDIEFIFIPVNEIEKKSILIFPNPALDIIQIAGPEQIEITAYRLYNMQGQPVISIENPNSGYEFSINVSHLSAGLYNLKLDTKQGQVNYIIEILR